LEVFNFSLKRLHGKHLFLQFFSNFLQFSFCWGIKGT
jgi:hypothetical protein